MGYEIDSFLTIHFFLLVYVYNPYLSLVARDLHQNPTLYNILNKNVKFIAFILLILLLYLSLIFLFKTVFRNLSSIF